MENDRPELGDLAGAIEKLDQIITDRERAEAVRVIQYDDIHDRLSRPDGTVEYKPRPAPPRRHILKALDQVPAFAEHCEYPRIWYNEEGVTVVCDDQPERHHDSRATLQFCPHDEWMAVKQLVGRTFGPGDLVKFLKFRLWETLDDKGEQFLKSIRRIQFSQQQSTRHTNDVTAKSLGRDVAAQVETETGDLDQFETLVLQVRPSTDRTVGMSPVNIRVGFETDPLLHTLQLEPLGGEIDRGVQQFVRRVEDYLKGETDVPCLYGSPD